MQKQTSITVEVELLARLDKKRGRIDRSSYIENLIDKDINAPEVRINMKWCARCQLPSRWGIPDIEPKFCYNCGSPLGATEQK